MNSLSQYIGILKAASIKPNTRRPLTECFIGQQILKNKVEQEPRGSSHGIEENLDLFRVK